MSVASFRDSELTFEFAGFLNDWVNACTGNDFFMRRHRINVWHFSNEVSSRKIANARDRSEDMHRFLMFGIYFCDKFGLEPGQFFFQIKEFFDTAFQDFFSVFIVNADGTMGDFHNFAGGEFYFSTFASGDFFDDFSNFFLSQFSGAACRRNQQQEIKYGFGENVMFRSQFIKDVEGDLFNAVFEFSDFAGDCFALPGEEISSFSGVIGFDFVGFFEEEMGDGFCRDFVGGGFSQSVAFFEVFDQKWIEKGNVISIVDKEIKDIDMIAARGFNADGKVLWVADGLQVFQEFVKSFFVLEKSFFRDDFFLCVKDTDVQGIKGYIYANKIFIVRHDKTSFFALDRLNNGNRMLSLPSSIVIRDLCPNQLIGNGESRGQTPLRALGPGFMSSPCFQFLNSISSLIISKLYSNST